MTARPGSGQPYAEVIGDPIAHSKSPLIHRFWLEKLGIPADYWRRQVAAAALADYFTERCGDPDWRGCNVTVPHKQAVLKLADRLDPLAERIGAVNTVVREEDGALVGYNTDASGFLEPLRDLLARRWTFRMARIIGNGGAALAIAHALADEGFVIAVIARDPLKARALQRLIGRADEEYVASLADCAEPLAFDWGDRSDVLDLVVNATSLGMAGQPPLPFDLSHAPPGAVVYDIVYTPLETPLLAAARARGLTTVDGLGMLIGQAAAAFALFFGQAAPRELDQELRALLTA